ncbi:MAG: hypothetical protein IKK62_08790 [Bacteroidaceae bacterium]|nr:hypothetical protein [Bacteroidaceae bacterium]
MKKIIGIMSLLFACVGMSAQDFVGYSNRTTVYETYQPAKVTLTTGKVILQKQANIFLKNGRMLFKNGHFDMEANMAQIKAVEFKDRTYVRVDTILATVVDTVGVNRILCRTLIDLEAFSKQKINDRVLSNFQMTDMQVSATTVDSYDGDNVYPLFNEFFFEIDGKLVLPHERVIRRMLPKKQRSRLDFYMQQPDFSWSEKASLRLVLELFEK